MVFGEVFDKKDEEDLHLDGESGILTVMSDQIESRWDGVGVPSDIYKYDKPLSSRQQELLNELPKYDSRTWVDKSDVSMMDLSALTAKTNVEFAMFTKGSERLVVRGAEKDVPIDEIDAAKLRAEGYKWSGHTHVGTDLIPSDGDRAVLKAFNQSTGVIYNAIGKYNIYGIGL